MIPLDFTGSQLNYFYICQTKLWYFSHNLNMEHNSDLVSQGKHINDSTYQRNKKDELIDNKICIDYIKKGEMIEIHEIKKSNKMEKAHIIQVKYYLFYLKNKGIKAKAILDYPKLRKREEIILEESDENELQEALIKIKQINDQKTPPEPARKPFCPKCSYYDLCWCD